MKVEDFNNVVALGDKTQLYKVEFSDNLQGVALLNCMFQEKSVFSFSSGIVVSAVCALRAWHRANQVQLVTVLYENLLKISSYEEFVALLEKGLVKIELYRPTATIPRVDTREACF